MAEIENGQSVDWVVNARLGDYIFDKVNNSARLKFSEPGSIAVLAKFDKGASSKNLVRLSGSDYDDGRWIEPFSLTRPEVGAVFNFDLQFESIGLSTPARGIAMAVYAYTSNGAMFTHEYRQDRGSPAEILIRVPIPDSMRGVVSDSFEDDGDCEVVREQVRTLQDRFADVDDFDTPTNYYQPHLECSRVTSTDTIIDVIDRASDIVERGVRNSK